MKLRSFSLGWHGIHRAREKAIYNKAFTRIANYPKQKVSVYESSLFGRKLIIYFNEQDNTITFECPEKGLKSYEVAFVARFLNDDYVPDLKVVRGGMYSCETTEVSDLFTSLRTYETNSVHEFAANFPTFCNQVWMHINSLKYPEAYVHNGEKGHKYLYARSVVIDMSVCPHTIKHLTTLKNNDVESLLPNNRGGSIDCIYDRFSLRDEVYEAIKLGFPMLTVTNYKDECFAEMENFFYVWYLLKVVMEFLMLDDVFVYEDGGDFYVYNNGIQLEIFEHCSKILKGVHLGENADKFLDYLHGDAKTNKFIRKAIEVLRK